MQKLMLAAVAAVSALSLAAVAPASAAAFAELPTANGTDTSCRYAAEIESINLELEAQLA